MYYESCESNPSVHQHGYLLSVIALLFEGAVTELQWFLQYRSVIEVESFFWLD